MAVTLFVVLVPFLTAMVTVGKVVVDQTQAAMTAELDNRLRIAAMDLEQLQDQVRYDVASVAMDNTVKTTLRFGVFSQLRRYLVQQKAGRTLDFLLVADDTGRPVAMAPIDVEENGGGYPGRRLIERVRRRQLAAKGLWFDEDLLPGADPPPLVLEAAAPIMLRRQLLGYVVGGLRLDGDQGLLRRLQLRSGADHVVLLEENGRLTASWREADQEAEQAGRETAAYSGLAAASLWTDPRDGRQYDLVRRILSDIDGAPVARLVILLDHAKAMAGVRRVTSSMLLIFAGGVLLAVLLTLVFSSSLARPIAGLVRAMEFFRREGRTVPVPDTGPEEIGRLARVFNEMSATIEASLEQLQREVEERRRTEAELHDRQERLAIILDSIGDGVLVLDSDNRVVYCNPAAETMIGMDAATARGKPFADVLRLEDEESGDLCVDPAARLERAGEDRLGAGTMLLTTVTGDRRHVACTASFLRDSQGRRRGLVLVLRDVTAQRRLDEEMIRAQKLESLGLLAGGIAHDFNNLLTAIVGNINLARVEAIQGRESGECLERAEKAAMQARTLTRQLLVFAKGGEPVRKPLFTDQLIREAVELALRGSNVGGRFKMAPDLWPVEADEGQLHQVFNNLAINAVQAMPSGGTLTVRAENVVLGPANHHNLSPGNYVKIEVEDTGCGIDPAHIDRIFDPYFSTKKTGHGLGLATVFSIVRKHDGTIGVESEPGRGTTFTILLPAFGGELLESAGNQLRPTVAGHGRVLVMDDEIEVRRTLEVMLRHLGYEPTLVADGQEALDAYGKAMVEGRPFRLVILDLTVPGGRGGKETAATLLQMDPAVRLVVVSGYGDDPVLAAPERYGFLDRLPKPFLFEDLVRVLARVTGDGERDGGRSWPA